jgi:hypothetical protein
MQAHMPSLRHILVCAALVICALIVMPTGVAAAAQKPVVVTSPVSSLTATAAALNATVNPGGLSTTYVFQYGRTTNYGSQTAVRSVGSGSTTIAVQATIYGLPAATTYHYRVVATNPLGTSWGADATFITTPLPPAVTLGKPSLVTDSAATFTGSVNPNSVATTYTFQYGTTTAYGMQTSPLTAGSGTSTKAVSAAVSGLAAGTAYYYRLLAASLAGTTVSAGASFVTTGTPVAPSGQAPVVSQAAAVKLTHNSVQLNGAVNPEGDPTTWHFEYGLTSSFGLETTPGTMVGLGIRPINAPISGLRSNTTYHFRLVANSAAGLYVGPDQTFTTKAAPPSKLRNLTLITKQHRQGRGLRVTVAGRLALPDGIDGEAWTGTITITFQRGDPTGPTFMLARTNVRSDGSYTLTTWFSRSHLHGHDHYGVTVRFNGNSQLQKATKQMTSFVSRLQLEPR